MLVTSKDKFDDNSAFEMNPSSRSIIEWDQKERSMAKFASKNPMPLNSCGNSMEVQLFKQTAKHLKNMFPFGNQPGGNFFFQKNTLLSGCHT